MGKEKLVDSEQPGRGKANLEAARARMYRELIFETAEQIFADRGFTGAGMQEIAAAAGISPRTLYATFPGKQELYEHILEERSLGLISAVGRVSGASNHFGQLTDRVRALVDYLTEHAAFFQILLQDRQAWGVESAGEESAVEGNPHLRETAEILEAGMEAGEFHRSDPDLLAAAIIAMTQSLLAGMMLRTDEPDAEAISEEIVLHIGRLVGAKP
jgi:AcrR family transcriptional regulator